MTSPQQHDVEDGLCVVIVSYGSPALLHDALGALHGAYRTIVVDNSSSPQARTLAKEADAHYVDPGENIGYARAVNLALALRRAGDDVLLVNPDACISPPAIERMRRVLRSWPKVACVTPAQHTPGSDVLSPVWWPWHTPGRAWAEAVGLRRLRSSRGFMGGAIMLIGNAALDDVGGLDERYFLYSEDEDWQRRAVKSGWNLHHCPEVKAVHGGGQTESDLERLQLRLHSAIERYIRKWYGPLGWMIYRSGTILNYGLRIAVNKGDRRRTFVRLTRVYLQGPDAAARRRGAVPDTTVSS